MRSWVPLQWNYCPHADKQNTDIFYWVALRLVVFLWGFNQWRSTSKMSPYIFPFILGEQNPRWLLGFPSYSATYIALQLWRRPQAFRYSWDKWHWGHWYILLWHWFSQSFENCMLLHSLGEPFPIRAEDLWREGQIGINDLINDQWWCGPTVTFEQELLSLKDNGRLDLNWMFEHYVRNMDVRHNDRELQNTCVSSTDTWPLYKWTSPWVRWQELGSPVELLHTWSAPTCQFDSVAWSSC